MMFGGSLFFLLIIGIVIAVIWSGFGNHSSGDRHGSKPTTQQDTPLEILEKRYAKGEITREEFERMKQDLSGHGKA